MAPIPPKNITPRAIKRGDTLALVAPGFCFDADLLLRGRQQIENRYGVKTSTRSDVTNRQLFFAGDTKRRVAELLSALTDPKIAGLVAIRGGYGCADIYPELIRSLKRIKNLEPKILVGFSDLTIILNGLYQDLGWVTFHGPVVVGRPFHEPQVIESDTFRRALFETKPLGKISHSSMTTLKSGEAQGVLVGGCLSLLLSTLGTDYEIKTDHKILFLEDIGEAPYKIHRMLTQLKSAGKLKKVRGIVFGQLTDCKPHSEAFADISDKAAIADALKDLKIPVIFDFPGGHGSLQSTFPLGLAVQLVAPKKGTPSLTFLKAAVR